LHIALIIALAGLLASALGPGAAWAQADTSEASAPTRYQQTPEADPADVKSPDAIVSAVYEAISRPAEEQPDWERFRSLFLPKARFIPTFRQEGEPPYLVVGVEGFIKQYNKRFGKEDFYEREIHAVTERFGDIAHVFSTYESSRSPDGEPFMRGITSFQLWYDTDHDRWWVVNIFWHTEREGAPIPERYTK
jgi:hypothetical protein